MLRQPIALAALLSWLSCAVLIRAAQRRGFGLDETLGEARKTHHRPTPRSGGIGVIAGIAAGVALACVDGLLPARFALALLGALVPLLASGVWEDLRRHLAPMIRAVAGIVSALLAVALIGVRIDRVDVPLLDTVLLHWPLAGAALSVIALGALPHAVNMIDGFHGLAGVVCAMILGAIAYVASKVGDAQIMTLAVIGDGALLGFLFWNWPRGDIFLGDTGAYGLGFIAALLATLLVQRHPQVSPWFPLLVLLYPSWELLFSVYRRRVRAGVPGMLADSLHLHHLVHRRLHRALHLRAREINASTAPYLWGLAAFSIVPAMLWWNDTGWLAVWCALFAAVYVWSYRSLLRTASADAD